MAKLYFNEFDSSSITYRYLSYIMDVARPTEYCLNLVYDLMSHVLMKENSRSTLSHQEVRDKLE